MQPKQSINFVMLDIETLGTGRNAAIMSIGACLFDPIAGRWPREEDPMSEVDATFYQKVDLSQGPQEHVGTIDASTVEWWLKQSREAQGSLVAGPRVAIQEALNLFSLWLSKTFARAHLSRYDTDVRLLSNGPTFDEDILRDAFARCKLKFPLHFKTSRCCRTIFDLACQAGWSPKAFGKNEKKHDALGDAIFQARGVCSMYAHLGLTGPREEALVPPENEVLR